MPIIYNNTEIPADGFIKFNETEIDKVIYNGVTVWEQSLWNGFIVEDSTVQENDAFTYEGTPKLYVNYNGTEYFTIHIKDFTKFKTLSLTATYSISYADQGGVGFSAIYEGNTVKMPNSISIDGMVLADYFSGESTELTLQFKCKSSYWHNNVTSYNIKNLYLQA